MSWAKYDDGHDDSAKVRRALREGIMGLAAIGLHTLSVTQSARRETDGLVDIDWLDEKLHRISARDRQRLMDVMTDVGFYDALAAGASVEATDTKGFTVTIGPIDESAHIVHDYLDYNDSSAYMAERRRKDAERKTKRDGRESTPPPSGVRGESERSPNGVLSSRARVPDPTRPDQDPGTAATPLSAGARTATSRTQAETVECPRCHEPAGEKCMGTRGRRESCHLERHHSVGELLHLKTAAQKQQDERGSEPKPYTPDPWAVSVQAEHFPELPVTTIEGAAFTLKCRRREPTVEAIRELLEAAA